MKRSEIQNAALAIEKEIRSSMEYHEWTKRNKSTHCVICDKTDKLECHHIPTMMSLIREYYKFYNDWKEVKQRLLEWHQMDMFSEITVCSRCHTGLHRNTKRKFDFKPIAVENWTTLPRNFNPILSHSTHKRVSGSIGLISLQTVFGIGWHILNGNLESRILTFNRKRFAKLIYKTYGTSFNRSLNSSLNELEEVGVLSGTHIHDDDVELHLNKDFLKSLYDNPWFFPLREVRSSQMCSLALKMWLCYLSKRTEYRISIQRLREVLHIQTNDKYLIRKAIHRAVKEIPWASVKDDGDFFDFELQLRGAVPLRSLRHQLQEAIEG